MKTVAGSPVSAVVTTTLAVLCALSHLIPDTVAFSFAGLPSTKIGRTTLAAVVKRERVENTSEEWKSVLTDDQFYVLRQEGTETPNSSPLNDIKEPGTFTCAGCGAPLFVTDTKYDSGTGWPSFYAPIDNDAIAMNDDYKLLLPRKECRCATCDGHLGHVFDDGPNPTGQRYCMNGVAMKFTPDNEADSELLTEVEERRANSGPLEKSESSTAAAALWFVANILIGANAFQAFLLNVQLGNASSPLTVLNFCIAVYFAMQASVWLTRLVPIEDDRGDSP